MSFSPAAVVLFCLLLPVTQEKREDNAWLRCKPGTWVRNKLAVDAPDRKAEYVQTLTLKEIEGDDYVIEESYTTEGSVPARSRRSRGVPCGAETLRIAGKDYRCKISTVKGTNDMGPTEAKFWTPEGSKNSVKITWKQKGSEGDLMAVAVDEKVEVLGKTYPCSRLEGTVKFGETSGTLKLLLCEDIPGAQVRAELLLKGPDGESKVRYDLLEIHEEK